MEGFEEGVHTAQWKVIMARTIGYKDTAHGAVPCVELVDTNGPQVRPKL